MHDSANNYDVYKDVFDTSKVGTLFIQNGVVIDLNKKVLDLLCCESKADVVGFSLAKFAPENQSNGVGSLEYIDSMLQESLVKGLKFEFVMEREGGGKLIASFSAFASSARKDLIIATIDMCSDYKLLRKENELLQQRMALFFEHSMNYVYIKNESLEHIYGNPPFLEAIGAESADELVGTVGLDWAKEETTALIDELEKKVLEDEVPRTDLFEYELKNAQKGWVYFTKFVFHDIDGKKYLASIGNDVTELSQAKQQAEFALEQIIDVLSKVLEFKDPYTAGHELRVKEIAVLIAKKLNVSEDQLSCVKLAASSHDIGKISIPAEILNKPGKLSESEFNIIKEHPEVGYELLKDIEFKFPVADAVRQHHERLDGSGYPLGLQGDDILMESRITAVADVLEAMTSHRPYRPGLPIEVAVNELKAGKSILYDAQVVDACLSLLESGELSLFGWQQ